MPWTTSYRTSLRRRAGGDARHQAPLQCADWCMSMPCTHSQATVQLYTCLDCPKLSYSNWNSRRARYMLHPIAFRRFSKSEWKTHSRKSHRVRVAKRVLSGCGDWSLSPWLSRRPVGVLGGLRARSRRFSVLDDCVPFLAGRFLPGSRLEAVGPTLALDVVQSPRKLASSASPRLRASRDRTFAYSRP